MIDEVERLRGELRAAKRTYSQLVQKTLDLMNAIPDIEIYEGAYLWPMNPPPDKVKAVKAAISKAILFIDANPRDKSA